MRTTQLHTSSGSCSHPPTIHQPAGQQWLVAWPCATLNYTGQLGWVRRLATRTTQLRTFSGSSSHPPTIHQPAGQHWPA